MTETKNKIEIKVELPEVANEALKPVAARAGNTFALLWDGLLADVNLWAQKKEYQRQKNFEQFVKDIDKKYNQIPQENIQEPKLNIAGPALEASKYFFEEDQYREMFSNLIASSMDASKNDIVHPAFVEVIKQLTSNDARMLMKLRAEPYRTAPIVNLTWKSIESTAYILQDLLLDCHTPRDHDLDCLALDNLQRQNLVVVHYDVQLSGANRYDSIEENRLYLDATRQFKNRENFVSISVIKGVARFTKFGEAFMRVCL